TCIAGSWSWFVSITVSVLVVLGFGNAIDGLNQPSAFLVDPLAFCVVLQESFGKFDGVFPDDVPNWGVVCRTLLEEFDEVIKHDDQDITLIDPSEVHKVAFECFVGCSVCDWKLSNA